MLEIAEDAVGRLSLEELEEFLRWLSRHTGGKLDSLGLHKRLSAQELAERYEERIQRGETQPFAGVDLSAWPAATREKAEAIIAEWQSRHGK